jgi:hypothetical protein
MFSGFSTAMGLMWTSEKATNANRTASILLCGRVGGSDADHRIVCFCANGYSKARDCLLTHRKSGRACREGKVSTLTSGLKSREAVIGVTASLETTKYGFAPCCVSSFEPEPGDIVGVDAENAADFDRPVQRELAHPARSSATAANRNFCLQLTIFMLAFRPLGLGRGISDGSARSKSI